MKTGFTIEAFNESELDEKTEKLVGICEKCGAVEVVEADERVWKVRACFQKLPRRKTWSYRQRVFPIAFGILLKKAKAMISASSALLTPETEISISRS